MQAAEATLTRKQIREVLKSAPGTMKRIAEDLQVSLQHVSLVMKGRAKSSRVFSECERRALEILRKAAA